MSLREQQDFLARLFTDESLRQNFLSEPTKIGAENGLNESEIDDLKAVLPSQLEFFSESLFWKRLREAEKFLPFTKQILGEDFQPLFRQFSQNYNPQTVKKHLEDAFEFCKFLQKSDIPVLAKNIAAFEKAKLSIYGYGKRFAFCKLDHDIRPFFDGKSLENPQRKWKIAVWIKLGNKIRHFFI